MGEFNLFCFYFEVLCFMCRVKSVSCIWWWVLVFLLWYKSCGNFYAVLFFFVDKVNIFASGFQFPLLGVFYVTKSRVFDVGCQSFFVWCLLCVVVSNVFGDGYQFFCLVIMCCGVQEDLVVGTSFFVELQKNGYRINKRYQIQIYAYFKV